MHRVLPLLLCVVGLVSVPLAQSASSTVVVSQVFAGGGNSGASYANDFVELLNRGSTAVDVSGWTVQYASASATSWTATALAGSLQPGHYYLLQLASGGAVGSALPAPDATGTTNLAVSGGKVALVRDSTALGCGATAGSCTAVASVEDFVGYGSATDYEGTAAAPALSSTAAAARAAAGCTDTGDNAADFATAPPAPRNASSAVASCTTTVPTSSASQGASVDVDVQPLLSITLERSNVTFGSAVSGNTPAPISEHVTVVSNNAAGYSLSAHRAIFTPADLPLGIGLGTAPLVAIPIAPAADLVLGSTSGPSAPAGDLWAASLGFTAPLPVVAPGHYTTTVTFTVIAR